MRQCQEATAAIFNFMKGLLRVNCCTRLTFAQRRCTMQCRSGVYAPLNLVALVLTVAVNGLGIINDSFDWRQQSQRQEVSNAQHHCNFGFAIRYGSSAGDGVPDAASGCSAAYISFAFQDGSAADKTNSGAISPWIRRACASGVSGKSRTLNNI